MTATPPLLPLDVRESQATACLEAAARYQPELLAVATKLAGSKEGGMELFQQTCLNCHDAIQHRGYAGTEYRGYLVKAIHRLHFRNAYLESLKQDLTGAEQLPAPTADPRHALAEQMAQEVQRKFPALRVAFRMHLDGMSHPQIADHIGGDQSWLCRQLKKVKGHLRATFADSWNSLGAE